ncbi:MAG: helix-turn-helix transcriptional regulator [bacterium]|nr:helix-turn-helix transcriptional regulator [bacterium]
MKSINKKTSIDPIAEARKDKNFHRYAQDANARIRLAVEVYNAREAQHISQQTLAKNIHSTQRVISNIENGDINVGLDLLNRLARNLNFTADQLSTIFGSKIDFTFTTTTATTENSIKKSTVSNITQNYSLESVATNSYPKT